MSSPRHLGLVLLFLALAALPACMRPVPVSASVKSIDTDGKVLIDVTATPHASISCSVVVGGVNMDAAGVCPSVDADTTGHATLKLDPVAADSGTVVTVTASVRGKTTTTTVALKDGPALLSTTNGTFTIIGRNCSGKVEFVPDLSVSAAGDCTAAPSASFHSASPPAAKVPVSELAASVKGALDSVPVEVTLKDGQKLTGTLTATKEARRDALLAAVHQGKPMTGEEKEPQAKAAIIFPPDEKETPTIVGDQTATVGGMHFYATIAYQERKQTVKCSYTDTAGKVLDGDGDYMDGAAKLFDRHTQKAVAETLLRAQGSPCDAKQKLSVAATAAKTSYAWYSDDDLAGWVLRSAAARR